MSQVDKMLREMAVAPTVQVVSRTGRVTGLARLVLVAEQFGFMYGDTHQTGGRAPKVVLTIHRDPDPEAQRRAADNHARFPQAGNGGDLPGMQPGGKLTPLPDAAPHLELLKARINFDLTGKSAEKRMLMAGIGLTAGCAVLVLRNLSAGTNPVVGIVVCVLLLLTLGGGFLWNRKRNARFENVLRQAGLTPVRDENGRTRYLPPGSRLPGPHNPFGAQFGAQFGTQFGAQFGGAGQSAGQGSGFPQQAPGAPAAQPAQAPVPGAGQPQQPPAPHWQFPPRQPAPQGPYGHGGPHAHQQGHQPPPAPPGQGPPQYGQPAPPPKTPPEPQPQYGPQYGPPQQPGPHPYQQGRYGQQG
ncbi:hypothetical protein [Streptomyces sp. WMMB 322]|uniref:hypothetical protein n=1 Tax=Streptomyces sp. WMMB 322 TaxID=1286821 RepID=UPI001586EBDD|nr:hypothetical protein [Streptomyces sp. WMMB 322]